MSAASSDFLQLSAQASEPASGLYSSYLSQATSIESGAWEGGFSLSATGEIDASAGQVEAVASAQNGSARLASEADVAMGGSGSSSAGEVTLAQGGLGPPSAPSGQIVLPSTFGEQASILDETFSSSSRLASSVKSAPIVSEAAPRMPLAGPTGNWQNYLKAERDVLAGVPDTVTGSDALGPPIPRVDVSSKFSRESLGGGAVQYRYLDPTGDGGHGLIMAIDSQGTLGFDIRAEGDVATLGTGTDMFASGMQRLSADGIQVNAIRGFWVEDTGSVNLQQFTENLKTMDPQTAAANTWTGRIAGRYGYLQVSTPTTNMFGKTTVIFSKGTP